MPMPRPPARSVQPRIPGAALRRGRPDRFPAVPGEEHSLYTARSSSGKLRASDACASFASRERRDANVTSRPSEPCGDASEQAREREAVVLHQPELVAPELADVAV